MISPISFGSTYLVASSSKMPPKQQMGYDQLKRYCDSKWLPYNERTQYNIKQQYGTSTFRIDSTIVAPKTEDKNIEQICAESGVRFNKLDTNSLLSSAGIMSRVKEAPEGFQTAVIDSEKLEKILLTQEMNNFKSTKKVYNKEHKKETNFMLLSGEQIPASTLYITTMFSPEEVLPAIQKEGKPEEDSIVFNILRETEDVPDNCMYFAMKDAGMKDIPVYLDEPSYNAANALGIIKKQVH